uniref:Uncharacterized protein n=1 Tax=Populus trichocarpa TaxID=3694 RepID=B9IFA7_POPTR
MICNHCISLTHLKQGTANELLRQIRQLSSQFGDATQRLAHFFANGLEARLAGSGDGTRSFFTSLSSKRTTAADKLTFQA